MLASPMLAQLALRTITSLIPSAWITLPSLMRQFKHVLEQCFETRAVRTIVFCDSTFTNLSLMPSLVLILLPMWNFLVHSTTWGTSAMGARGCVYWRCRTAKFGLVDGGADLRVKRAMDTQSKDSSCTPCPPRPRARRSSGWRRSRRSRP